MNYLKFTAKKIKYKCLKFRDYWRNCGYRRKIMIAFLCISLIPLVILGSFCFTETKILLTKQAEANLLSSLNQSSLAVNSQLESYNQIIGALCVDNSLDTAANMEYTSYYTMFEQLKYNINDKFVSVRNLISGIEEITLYSDKNLPKYGRIAAPVSEITDTPWYKRTEHAVNAQWFLYKGELLCVQPVLSLRHFNPSKNLIVMKVKQKSIFISVKDLIRENIGILITDDNGDEISHVSLRSSSFYPEILLNKLKCEHTFHRNNMNKINRVKVKNKNYAFVSAPLHAANWTLTLYIPDSRLERQTALISCTVFFMLLFCLFAVYIASRNFSHRMVCRIENLGENMKSVAEGRMAVYARDDSTDEIGEMIRDFGKMIEQINRLIQENYEAEFHQKQAEMKALQAQINPHFLYNALSLINWRAIRLHAYDISEMTRLLSDFYRLTLNKGESMISIADEILNVQSYIKIQLIMHNDSFDVEYRIDHTLSGCMMPNLMLQPLVENAIIHGIENKEHIRGYLLVACERKENDIFFTVKDNGIGICECELSRLLYTDSKGYGLKNVHQRSRILYGEAYGLTVCSVYGQGAEIILRIPAAATAKRSP